MGVDASTHTVYVGNFGAFGAPASASYVSVIDGATNSVTATIPVGGYPDAVGVDPSTDSIYVGRDSAPGTVSVIDGATNSVTATIPVGSNSIPTGVAVDPTTHTVYVANSGEPGTVSVIDGSTNAVTATIPVGNDPAGIGVDPTTHTAYVANSGDPDKVSPGTVSVITAPVTDTDLALSQPGNITTDATGPSGTKVTYDLPTVTDEDAAPPSPSCSPASGLVFAIGTTTVTCSVTDPDDSPSTVTVTFTVTMKGAAAQLTDLYYAVQGVGPGTSLSDKVAQAQSYLASGDVPDMCSTLGAFLHEVAAQSGKSIPADTASALIADAQRIQAVLAC